MQNDNDNDKVFYFPIAVDDTKLPKIGFSGWKRFFGEGEVQGWLIIQDVYPGRKESAAGVSIMTREDSDPVITRHRIVAALMSLADLLQQDNPPESGAPINDR